MSGWTKEEAEAIEQAVDQAPKAPDLQKAERERQLAEQAKRVDHTNRMFCIQEATRACAAGGYEPDDIMKVTLGFYGFLIGQTTQDAAMRENAPPKVPLRKS